MRTKIVSDVKVISALILFLALTLTNLPLTHAQEAEEESAPRKERKQTLNFEDELVEGSTQKPELFYLFQKKNFNYKKLIKLRENFLPEMRQTAEDVQRLRSAN